MKDLEIEEIAAISRKLFSPKLDFRSYSERVHKAAPHAFFGMAAAGAYFPPDSKEQSSFYQGFLFALEIALHSEGRGALP